jgi:hypothetical protein
MSRKLLHPWNTIKANIVQHPVNHDSDVIAWSLSPSKSFTTLYVYRMLEKNLAGTHNKGIFFPRKVFVATHAF